LTLADREAIELRYREGERPQDIADSLGVHVATIYNELKRGDTGDLDCNMRQVYSAKLAQLRLQQNLKRRGSWPKQKQQKLETVTT
jgi:IS30 family transposase